LIAIADAVEIKCTLSGGSPQPAMSSFGLLRNSDRTRTVWFFDSIDQASRRPRLLQAG